MLLRVFDDRVSLGRAAASQAASAIRSAIASRGHARVVAASAASQFEFLEELTTTPGIDWKQVELFHLDEYIGLPMTHPASFCKFLQERLISKTSILKYHLLDGSQDPADVIRNALTAGTSIGAISTPARIEFRSGIPGMSSRKRSRAISGPILSTEPPCFGQTGVKCRTSLIPPAVLRRVTLD